MSGPAQERCVTCSDEAVQAVVVATAGAEAVVRVAGDEERVAIDLVPDAARGDLLLCHAGIALERLERPDESAQVTQCHEAPAAPPAERPDESAQVTQCHEAPGAPPAASTAVP